MYSLTFFGTDQYAALVLNELVKSGKVTIQAVVTDRPKPKDRGLATEPFPVEKIAIKQNINILYYPSNNEEMNNFIDNLKKTFSNSENIGLCASFDHLVPSEVINLFKNHLYNLHPSLLPQYRNVSPVQYTLALGDNQTGITLFRITPGIDNGEIVGQSIVEITKDDTTPSLSSKLFPRGAQLFMDLLDNKLAPLPLQETNQPAELIFTKRLTRESGFIEWPLFLRLVQNQSVKANETSNVLLSLSLRSTQGIVTLDHVLRAVTPWPTVWTMANTTKGELRLTLESIKPNIMVKLASKPKAISWEDFAKYYLVN